MKKSQSIQEFVSSLIDGNLLQEGQSMLMSRIGGKNDSIPKNGKKSKNESKFLDYSVEVINRRTRDCSGENARCVNVGHCRGKNTMCKNVAYEGQEKNVSLF